MQASVASHMARLHPIWHSKRPVGCLRGWIWKSRGSIDLPPIGQHGENPIHQFNGSVASDPTISQIQQFQDNYNRITSNGYSRLSEDLVTFMFCSSLPKSYELTAQQYLDNITVIATDKITDIIAWVLQEESRGKAQSLGQGSSLNKFSTMKNIGQQCSKCGKTNHTTQNHWPGGKHPNKGKGQKSQKVLISSGNKKKADKKGKGKEMY